MYSSLSAALPRAHACLNWRVFAYHLSVATISHTTCQLPQFSAQIQYLSAAKTFRTNYFMQQPQQQQQQHIFHAAASKTLFWSHNLSVFGLTLSVFGQGKESRLCLDPLFLLGDLHSEWYHLVQLDSCSSIFFCIWLDPLCLWPRQRIQAHLPSQWLFSSSQWYSLVPPSLIQYPVKGSVEGS